jgi:hypothetical protein
MRDRRANNWLDLMDALHEQSWNETLHRHRSRFAYRGMSRKDHPLTTGLSRLGEKAPDLENHLLRNFRKYAERAPGFVDSIWNWLALAQHHGLPTRLLDWSYSPFVALHFATQDPSRFDVDGAIYCVDFSAVHQLLPDKLKRALASEGSDVFTVEMLAESCATLADLEKLSGEPFPLFLEPPSLNPRIVNQYALFSLMSNGRDSFEEWMQSRPELCFRVIIPAELKWEVRDKLDQANINERVLFPGLDGLARWLSRFYTPRTPTRDR